MFAAAGASPITDTSFATSYTLQVGFEYPFIQGNSGIPPRIPVTFSGANTATYSASTGPFGWITSDVIDIGRIIPAGANFGLWTLIEATGLGTAPVPATDQASNYITGRYTGSSQQVYTQVGSALTATGITLATSAQSGSLVYSGLLLVEDLDNTAHVLGIGDSTMYGVGEGYANSTLADIAGDSAANVGWYERFVTEKLGLCFTNFGRSSDSFSNLATSANWTYRQQGIALVNPTHIFCGHGINDLFDTNGATGILGYAQTVYGLMLAQASVPIIQATILPNAGSTDNYVTTVNQTPNQPTVRNTWNDTYVRTYGSALGAAGFVDPNPLFEAAYTEGGSDSGKWVANGTANYATLEGVHPSSNVTPLVITSAPYCSRGGTTVTNPFT